jgi:predicted lipoprotein with Yx(FWY)xxD motif
MTTFIIILVVILGIIIFLLFIKNDNCDDDLTTFQVAYSEKLGKYLTDSEGHALYYYKEDEIGTSNSLPVSTCGEDCLGIWQIVNENKMTISPYLNKSGFSNIVRHQDGQIQTVYNGHPLYRYINDTNPGDAKGEGINNVWFVVKIN